MGQLHTGQQSLNRSHKVFTCQNRIKLQNPIFQCLFSYCHIFSFPLLQSIFEQVWAGEDFHLFKKIMVKKNLDLELQALHMIQQRNGVVPQVFASGKML